MLTQTYEQFLSAIVDATQVKQILIPNSDGNLKIQIKKVIASAKLSCSIALNFGSSTETRRILAIPTIHLPDNGYIIIDNINVESQNGEYLLADMPNMASVQVFYELVGK